MSGPGSGEHRERARRAQQLSDRAREQSGSERTAAERSERLMGEHDDPGLTRIHRQVAALHRQAQHHYERVAEFQQLHAEHERHAAELQRPEPDPEARGAAADRRDTAADERERLADLRDRASDERERFADQREQLQDERDQRLGAASGLWTPGERAQLARAKAAARRIEARLARQGEGLDRADASAIRDQTTIERENTVVDDDPPAVA
jgi:hypothetical protein